MASEAARSEEGLEGLYTAPLAEFTKERNALAKRLRDDGEGERADEVKALGKPSVPAWVINQGVRADAKSARALLKAGEDLRAAHERALGGDANDLREAMSNEAAAVDAMTDAAAKAARPEKLSGSMLDRVRDTLRALAGDDELRGEFEAGRVSADRRPVGLGGGHLVTEKPRGQKQRKSGPTAAQRRKADASVTKARKALDARRRDVAGATEEAEKARRAAKDAGTRLAEAEEAERSAQEDLEAAEAERAEL